MASNFKIKSSRVGDELYINLAGDFDGSSACELLNDMNEKADVNVRRILVDTSRLRTVHPFGRMIFQKQMPLKKRIHRKIVFIGRNAHKLMDHSEAVFH